MDIHEISPYIRVATRSQTKYLGWEIKERVIFDYELQYIKKGSILVNIEGKEYIGQEGDIFLYKPKQPHTMKLLNNEGMEQPHIHFDFYYKEDSPQTKVNFCSMDQISIEDQYRFREDIGMLFNIHIPNHIRLKNPKVFETMLFDIIEEKENALPFYELKIKAKFIELWTYLVRELYSDIYGVPMENNHLAKQVLEFININLCDDINLNTLESEFHFSKNYLIHCFVKSYGITPMKYLQQKRLEKSKELLAIGKYTVSEVSRIVRYNSVQAFSRAFKKVYKESPSKYT